MNDERQDTDELPLVSDSPAPATTGLRRSALDTRGYPAIGDYALIGDCRSAALVSNTGSIDWLPLPRFDCPTVFATLLDRERGGHFAIRPVAPFQATRRYLPGTNVLETTFVTASGSCTLCDLMPVYAEEDKRRVLVPEHEVLREIEGIDGEVELEILYEPRPDYGRRAVALRDRGTLGIWHQMGSAALFLVSEAPLEIAEDGASAFGRVTVNGGDVVTLSLSYCHDGPAVIPLLREHARKRIEGTAAWWRGWSETCGYDGPYRDEVVRSSLALKLLSYAPSGAIIAAPTTSLPEVIGGEDNWDYRYCWLRDASYTLRALYALDFDEEAEAFVSWVLHATRLSWPELRILYDVHGRDSTKEQELDHLAGYADSRPVRIGNGAMDQLQLNIYGEVADAALRYAERGGRFERDTAHMLKGIGQTVCKRWREPDEGIWETRGGRQQHTHSKVLCWVTLDRLIALHDRFGLDIPIWRFHADRNAIRAEIETRGYSERLGSYTTTLGGEEVDASLLTLPLYGYIEPAHARMRSTYERIIADLGSGPLVYRNPGGGETDFEEGAFGICGFWAVEVQARAGDVAGAVERFEALLGYANEVGLFAEEIDPDTGAALGNFPPLFTHVGLLNAALTLQELQQSAPAARLRNRATAEAKSGPRSRARRG